METLESTSLIPAGIVPSANRRFPDPITSGKTHKRYSSTRPWRISVWIRFPLPWTWSSGPFPSLSFATPPTGRVVSMTIRIDPEGNETDALFDLVEVEGREVLEIGCGDGRLTRRYADRVAHVTAIDPFEDAIARAQKWLSEAPNERIELRHATFEDLAAASDADVFDVALLSWSLC